MPRNQWSRLKTPDCEVQSFSRWCLPAVARGTMVLTVVLSHRSTSGNPKDVHYALDGTLALRVYGFCSLFVGEHKITERLNSPVTYPQAFMLHWLHYHLLDIRVTVLSTSCLC